MEMIQSKNDSLTWNILKREVGTEGKGTRTFFTVACSVCGHQLRSSRGNLERRKACPGCSQKPPALKTDESGNCISICEIGTIEFIRDLQEKHQVSEREAVRQFIETIKAHLPADDPVIDQMSEESVRSSVRRATGKKSDHSESRGGSPQNHNDSQTKKFMITADPESVQLFLSKYLPDYQLVRR